MIKRYILPLTILVLSFFGCGENSGALSEKKKLLIPLYAYPYSDSTWDDLIALQKSYPSVEIVAIANQSNGDFTEVRDSYLEGIKALTQAGIKVIGYVYTEKGTRPLTEVQANIDAWVAFYKQQGLSGFFFDQGSNDAQDFAYYEAVSNYAKAKGINFIVLNPGAMVDDIYMTSGIASVIVTRETTYENITINTEHFIEPTASTKMGLLIHSSDHEGIVEDVYLFATEYQFDYIYATDHGLTDDRWHDLSSYIEELMQKLI